MATSSENQAAWLTAKGVSPFEVGPGPAQDTCGPDEVVIRVRYAAVNPVDWKMQDHGFIPLAYPHILGSDVAGEVVLVGHDATRFEVGDRVIGHCLGLVLGGAKHGGFQNFTTCRQVLVARIPDAMPYEEAVVLPLAISTATTGLFHISGLDLPSLEPKDTGKAVVIWGGSSSCGSAAIQLASAAGYTVVTTASPHNHEYVKSLGARYAFDQAADDVVEQIAQVVNSKLAGVFDCISNKTTEEACAEILRRNGGGKLPVVLMPQVNVDGVEVVGGTTNQQLGEAVWGQYVPVALATGRFIPKPKPYVITGGLSMVQSGLDMQKKGVSAVKIVVKL